jgi:hypothetical protein
LKFNGKSFEPVTGTITYMNGICTSADFDSPEVDIPTSKHVNKCCGDDEGDAPEGDDDAEDFHFEEG